MATNLSTEDLDFVSAATSDRLNQGTSNPTSSICHCYDGHILSLGIGLQLSFETTSLILVHQMVLALMRKAYITYKQARRSGNRSSFLRSCFSFH